MNDKDTIPPKPLPWFKDGLNFKCTECGKCCTGSPGFVWVTEEEIAAQAALLGIPRDLFMRRYVRKRDNRYALIEKKSTDGSGFDCVFLKDRKCTIYTARPKQCRTFPWWKENLNSPESWRLAALECEGINIAAPLVQLGTIESQLQ